MQFQELHVNVGLCYISQMSILKIKNKQMLDYVYTGGTVPFLYFSTEKNGTVVIMIINSSQIILPLLA